MEQSSSNEEVRPGDEAQTEAEEESVTEKSVPTEVMENQSERERGMEQNNVSPKLKTRISYRLIMTVPGEKALHTVELVRLAERKQADRNSRSNPGKRHNCRMDTQRVSKLQMS